MRACVCVCVPRDEALLALPIDLSFRLVFLPPPRLLFVSLRLFVALACSLPWFTCCCWLWLGRIIPQSVVIPSQLIEDAKRESKQLVPLPLLSVQRGGEVCLMGRALVFFFFFFFGRAALSLSLSCFFRLLPTHQKSIMTLYNHHSPSRAPLLNASPSIFSLLRRDCAVGIGRSWHRLHGRRGGHCCSRHSARFSQASNPAPPSSSSQDTRVSQANGNAVLQRCVCARPR